MTEKHEPKKWIVTVGGNGDALPNLSPLVALLHKLGARVDWARTIDHKGKQLDEHKQETTP